MKKILLISNGYGEDYIASNLAEQFLKYEEVSIHAFPLVGDGSHYKKNNIPTLFENQSFPSGGFIRSLSALITDIKAGLWEHIKTQRSRLLDLSKQYDIVIAIGDVFCLYMAQHVNQASYFLPTAKSNSFMSHSFIERILIRKWALHSFPRDEITCSSFKTYQLKASFFGNPMMDNLISDKQIMPISENELLICLLPGSRNEAYQNFALITKVCEHLITLFDKKLHFVAALAPTIIVSELAKNCQGTLVHHNNQNYIEINNLNILLSNDFLACINQADNVIGLSGTANEQALHIGKPVFAFKGSGPQSTLKRFYEQQELMNNKLIVIPNPNASNIATTIHRCIVNRKNLKQIPVQSIHHPASSAIVKKILKLQFDM
jgi:uncharacterized protein (TIGR03492 family)